MTKRDVFLTLAGSALVGLYLIPTLLNTGTLNKIPSPFIILFVVIPTLSLLGMFFVHLISKKIAILWQIAKFALVGFLNTAIDFGILNFLSVIFSVTKGAGIIPINAVSVSFAIINSFYWNKDWVFASRKQANFITFAIITVIGLSINTAIVYILTTFFRPTIVDSPTLWANFAKALATIVSMVWNFLGYRFIVFR
ncbi:hypothetical protein A3I53_03195 [Candidatus Curtissbacteria bacterium RIFCSPLOWO2_02_FULL_40_13b]|uniref:GtrA/DPMS transmembrane domain-containing protein n=3 Tax=Candidatus Curtissiibacteriota TaxID=1752717 RepID=A0A1F5HTZ3_9BACT|nr:MAG: hypothetical protein A2693_02950 [Candidatus Curtissbacteria bacterium RIFCSPHIGHO2_01_FULL_40_12]OGE03866.1 MAG: hypothetical protein A3F45_01130 [Candidatus Curtissbacteria bacterium RIFCSPHIGHO2_12_FULL_41_17]OGE07543.1 MAG: hypothetical protein A3I53_03195 [Candidatus Curtissbacteria bacterium RIFCSPLOWO2_02_FULL_40_13b]